jgi:tRNA A-37 threonylcarbamoyl transferase component Bud32
MIAVSRRIPVFLGESFQVAPAWRVALASVGISENADWPRVAGGDLVSASSTGRCFRLVAGASGIVYFKREVYPVWKWLEFFLRPAKTRIEVFAYRRFRELGIPAPEVLAVGERRICGMLVAAFVVTREVPDTVDLQRFATQVWWLMEPREKACAYREIAGQLLTQLRTAHDAGVYHRDLKWRNILVQKTGAGYLPVWIDAPRAQFRRTGYQRGVIVDLSSLARVALSTTSRFDRMRFLCRYLGADRKPGDARSLYRAVARHLQRRPPRTLNLPSHRGVEQSG